MPLVLDAVTGTWKVQSASGGSFVTHADYDAALTAMRGAGASDGDLYVTDTGLTLRAYTSAGPGILIPETLYSLTSGYFGGNSYFTTANTIADLTSSLGWIVLTASGSPSAPGGSLTGGGGSPFRFDSSATNSSYVNVMWYPFAPFTGAFAIVKMQAIASASPATAFGQCYAPYIAPGGASPEKRLWVDPYKYNGAFGKVGEFTHYNGVVTRRTALIESGVSWFVSFINVAGSPSYTYPFSYARKMEPFGKDPYGSTVFYSPLANSNTTATPTIGFRAYKGSIGAQSIFDVYEAHVFEM